jgi:hypothetical protein
MTGAWESQRLTQGGVGQALAPIALGHRRETVPRRLIVIHACSEVFHVGGDDVELEGIERAGRRRGPAPARRDHALRGPGKLGELRKRERGRGLGHQRGEHGNH